jgi:hypothetical protein
MKKILFLLFSSVAVSTVNGQNLRLNGYAHYVFDDKFDSYYDPYNYYQGQVKGGFQGGVGLEYLMQRGYCMELLWLHQTTTSPTYYQDGGVVANEKFTEFDLKIDYVLVGGEGHASHPSGKIEGYGGMYLGIAFLGMDNPDNGNSGSTSKFAWGLKLGANIWATPKIGLKVQTMLTSVTQGTGGGFYFGTGGAGVGLSSYSSIYQWSLGGGLTVRLGN